ncbi:unnamed protein product [Prorocentrum cordatum]|uniref:Uncharacterized protein n=1 Tax=Prorocentrum cordatum TaxID=2364126 RepID=A0ABN9Q4A1_9DINO|nr:unnamed protein product [Polarella glacialis]
MMTMPHMNSADVDGVSCMSGSWIPDIGSDTLMMSNVFRARCCSCASSISRDVPKADRAWRGSRLTAVFPGQRCGDISGNLAMLARDRTSRGQRTSTESLEQRQLGKEVKSSRTRRWLFQWYFGADWWLCFDETQWIDFALSTVGNAMPNCAAERPRRRPDRRGGFQGGQCGQQEKEEGLTRRKRRRRS